MGMVWNHHQTRLVAVHVNLVLLGPVDEPALFYEALLYVTDFQPFTSTVTVFVVSFPRMSMTLTITVYVPAAS